MNNPVLTGQTSPETGVANAAAALRSPKAAITRRFINTLVPLRAADALRQYRPSPYRPPADVSFGLGGCRASTIQVFGGTSLHARLNIQKMPIIDATGDSASEWAVQGMPNSVIVPKPSRVFRSPPHWPIQSKQPIRCLRSRWPRKFHRSRRSLLHFRRPTEIDEFAAGIVADITIRPQISVTTAGILIDCSGICEIGFET